jgi:hypothetical protein
MAITRAIGKTAAKKFMKNRQSQLQQSRKQSNPASSNAAATEMQKSKKKKKKKTRAAPAEEDGADQWRSVRDAQADDDNLRSASYGGFTDEEIGLSLELGTLVKKQFGELTPQTVARLVRTRLLGAPEPVGDRALPAMPPGLGLRPEKGDECEFVERPEVEKVLMEVLKHLIVQHLSSFKARPVKFVSPQRMYTVATISMKAPSSVVGPRSLRDLVKVLQLVESHAADLFDTSREKDKSARFMGELVVDTINHLDAALESVGGNEALLNSCLSDAVNDIRTTPADSLDIPEIIQGRVGAVLSLYSRGNQKQIVRSALHGTVQSSAAPAAYQHRQYPQFPVQQHMQSPAPVPPPPGPSSHLNLTNGRVLLRGLGVGVVGRYPMSKDSCALCGKGTAPGAVGHRAAECQATKDEKDNWREFGIWVI